MPTSYPNLRRCLNESYRKLPDSAIERVVAAQGLQARAIEDIWDDIGNFAASALPIVGGAIGSVVAPGVGTAIGAGLGSAAGSALHAAIGPGQQQQPAPQQPAMPAYPPTSPYGAAPYPYPYGYPPMPPQASSQQSAAALMQLLTRPELLQALMQMLLGSAGSPTVPVPAPSPAMPSMPASPTASGAAAVPVSALTNLLSTLATQTSEAYNAERAGTPGAAPFLYGAGPWGSSVDLASHESRAAALMEMLRQSDGGAGAIRTRRVRRQRLASLAQALRTVGDAGGRARS